MVAETDITIQQATERVLQLINSNTVLRNVLEAAPEEAIQLLANLTSSVVNRPLPLVSGFLLAHILNRTSPDLLQIQEFSQTFLRVGNDLLVTNLSALNMLIDGVEVAIIGSTFLRLMENFAANIFMDTGSSTVGNITLLVTMESTEEGVPVNSFRPRSEYSLQVPRQLLLGLNNRTERESARPRNRTVRMMSFLFRNVLGLFPNATLNGIQSELASDIISTALQCEEGELCATGMDDVDLDEPVIISIAHSEEVQKRLEADNSSSTFCVFWEFLAEESILSTGEWSDAGCSRNGNLSNTSVTVCECTHLTHFAILLSAAPLQLSQPVTLSLQIIGYVGVAISLVAMAFTVFTFIAFRLLHNMRNYIHINLCISLGIAQLTFVAGIDQSASDHVPIHCQAVAVLLHYFFLVSFMWMLMEGVVLYVALVRVFVERKKLYLLAFTLTSYGAPLLYLGVLTLPLGFALQPQHYGYNAACFLNPETKFIWAFIAPVLVIIVINTGFFIMAATIMWRHQKKEIDKAHLQKVKNWLRSAVSLVVIMGLTWVFGVLIVEVKELLALAYIYTILVAFQGVFIFFIFVILSQQVREAYDKWWRVKVNESDILSKLFRDRLTSSVVFSGKTSSTANGRPPVTSPTIPVAPPIATHPPEHDTGCHLATIPITEVSVDHDTDPSHSKREFNATRQWTNLRRTVQAGTVFKVIYSSMYFEPKQTEDSDTTAVA